MLIVSVFNVGVMRKATQPVKYATRYNQITNNIFGIIFWLHRMQVYITVFSSLWKQSYQPGYTAPPPPPADDTIIDIG